MTPEQARQMVADSTPGPWEHDGCGVVISPEIAEAVCEICGEDVDEANADAALISLAPEAMTLLADAMEYVQASGYSWRYDERRDLLARFAALAPKEET